MKLSTENKKIILRLSLFVVIIAVIILIGYLIFHLLGWTKMTQEELQKVIKSTGAVAPLIFILISFLQVTLIPIPGVVTIIAGNLLFGFWLSFLYSYVGMLLGAMFAFFLGRIVGRPFANWIVGSKEKVDVWIKRLKGRQNVVLFFMFFLPFFPDDVLCTVAGLLPISYFGFFIMQVITRATSIGFTLIFMSGEFIPYNGWGIAVLIAISAICVLAFIFSMKYSEKINDFFVDKINGICKKDKKSTREKHEK